MKKFAVVVAMLGFGTFVHAQSASSFCERSMATGEAINSYVRECLAEDPSNDKIVRQVRNLTDRVCRDYRHAKGGSVFQNMFNAAYRKSRHRNSTVGECHELDNTYRGTAAWLKKGGAKQFLRDFKKAEAEDRRRPQQRPREVVCVNTGSWVPACGVVP